jgi:hypothetical protein
MQIMSGIFPAKEIIVEHGKLAAIHEFLFQPRFSSQTGKGDSVRFKAYFAYKKRVQNSHLHHLLNPQKSSNPLRRISFRYTSWLSH